MSNTEALERNEPTMERKGGRVGGGGTLRKDLKLWTELSQAASLEIAFKSLVSVTQAPDMPAGRD